MKRLILFGLLLLVGQANCAELKLDGEAKEHNFIKVVSDKPGKWVVIGPDVLSFKSDIVFKDLVLGQPKINWRDKIILDDGKKIVFVGPPGLYIVIQFTDEPEPNHILIEVGGSAPLPPGPGPGPKPEPGPFDNLAQVVSRIPIARRAELKLAYQKTIDGLENGSLVSINHAAANIQTERAKILLAPEEALFQAAVAPIWNKNWPMDKSKVIDFYKEIVRGL